MNEILFIILIVIIALGSILMMGFGSSENEVEKMNRERLDEFRRKKYSRRGRKEINPNCKITDINSAEEKELKELPGINVILAKKIMKRRDEIGGFKDLDEFFEYTNLTETIKDQISPYLLFKEIKRTDKKEKSKERNIDL